MGGLQCQQVEKIVAHLLGQKEETQDGEINLLNVALLSEEK